MAEHYPLPKQRPKHVRLAASNPATLNEFGSTVEEYEERIFRTALCFNVVRFGTHNGSEIATVKTFPEALRAAGNDQRALVYCVGINGSAFCMPKKQYNKYARLYLEMRGAQNVHNP